MANENWQKAKEIFVEVLRQKPEDRPQFLEQVCEGDKTLRHEVESLLDSFDDANSFMEMPGIGAVGDVITNK